MAASMSRPTVILYSPDLDSFASTFEHEHLNLWDRLLFQAVVMRAGTYRSICVYLDSYTPQAIFFAWPITPADQPADYEALAGRLRTYVSNGGICIFGGLEMKKFRFPYTLSTEPYFWKQCFDLPWTYPAMAHPPVELNKPLLVAHTPGFLSFETSTVERLPIVYAAPTTFISGVDPDHTMYRGYAYDPDDDEPPFVTYCWGDGNLMSALRPESHLYTSDVRDTMREWRTRNETVLIDNKGI